MIKVELSGVKIISNCTEDELVAIKEDLTFDNPAYKSAKRHSRYGVGKIPPYIQYYEEGIGGRVLVPRSYTIPFPYEVTSDERLINYGVEYPKLRIELRDTQKQASEAYLKAYLEDKDENGVIILPTGKGKSILGLYLARKFSQRALVIVHKDDLVDGWTQDAKVIFGMKPKEVGLIKGKDFRFGKQITVTTIQTLSRLSPEKIDKIKDFFGMIIVDEFHHSVANIYKALSYFPARFKIGLTATAMRTDGLEKVLYHHFGKKVFEFIEDKDDEDILPATIVIKNVPMEWEYKRHYEVMKKYRSEISDILHNSGGWDDELYNRMMEGDPFSEEEVEEVFGEDIFDQFKKKVHPKNVTISEVRKVISFNDRFNRMLTTDVIAEYKQGKSCIVFTHEKEHCRVIEETLIKRGVPAEQIQLYYGDSKTPKEVMKKRAEDKEVLITIATYSIATEGTNVKAWERGFLASTVANEKDTIQAIGRCRRTKTGKSDCKIYDYRFPHVSVAKNHGKKRDKVYKTRKFTVIGEELKLPTKKQPRRGWGKFKK
ncbi:DNA helicase [Bacillus phage BCD7]|uniref:Putative type III restriction protein res subunit n=1 Tax=Bacillus phage BCD7 TaxID=1136534 RepID=J9PUL8_9CAUD|nr:DNA helicase [Bacillus phage BCD7]AEZ50521.1 putative type III restriction protein res subunit [Bacillus phage BCD7]